MDSNMINITIKNSKAIPLAKVSLRALFLLKMDDHFLCNFVLTVTDLFTDSLSKQDESKDAKL